MTAVDVLVIGNNTIDTVLVMRRPLAVGAKEQALSRVSYVGGQAANAAVTMAHLGLSVHYLGAFGDDAAGEQARGALAGAGCRLDGCPVVPGCPNQSAVVLVDELAGERSIVMHKDSRLRVSSSQVDPAWVRRAAAVYIDGSEPDANARAAAVAREAGRRVFADMEEAAPDAATTIAAVDELVAPMPVLASVTGRPLPAHALETVLGLGPDVAIATAGADGSVGLEREGSLVEQAAVPVRVVDTTGAGDAYHAAYVAARLDGSDLAEAMSYASAVGARKCSVAGPQLRAADVEDLVPPARLAGQQRAR